MEVMQDFILQQGIGLLVGLVVGVGLPEVIRRLRASSKKKLSDKDPSNDLAGRIEGGIADVLDSNKEKIGKTIELSVVKNTKKV